MMKKLMAVGLLILLTGCGTMESYPNEVYQDITLSASQENVELNGKDVLVWLKADEPTGTHPKQMKLMDFNTGKEIGRLRDSEGDAMFGWYGYGFWLKPDGTQETTDFCYYAEFADETGIHQSTPITIHVTE